MIRGPNNMVVTLHHVPGANPKLFPADPLNAGVSWQCCGLAPNGGGSELPLRVIRGHSLW